MRGISIAEARHALKTSSETIQLQIAKEPILAFGAELGDAWCDILVRTKRFRDDDVETKEHR